MSGQASNIEHRMKAEDRKRPLTPALPMNLGSEDGPLTPALSPKGEREKTSQNLHRVQGFNARILRGIF
jgi:hypothetical protein